MLGSTAAFAADATRSADALPTAQVAPTQGVRTATPLKKKSNLTRNAAIVGGIAAGAAIGTAIYLIADDDDNGPDSAG
ncbi:MAG TPA: hypothetical protein VM657_05780 [Sphingomonas sp.]|nr:hypothetical protein [Sphingomonas sp.]